MWNSHTDAIEPQISRTRLLEGITPLSYQRVIELLRIDARFRDYLTSLVIESRFEAFFWETPPLSKASLGKPFEFVCVESRSLANLKPDPTPFSPHFAKDPNTVSSFPNLGGDALLVVPKPVSEHSNYPHFARFLRHAPAAQVSELWQCAAMALEKRISDVPVWLSTAGMGVSWLHLRLDSNPKYYRYAPYKNSAA